MALIYRPWGNSDLDLTGAILVPETGLPQSISGLPAGSYELGRVSWDLTQHIISGNTAPTVTVEASVAVVDGVNTTTYTFTSPIVSASPAATVTRVLTLGGVNVTSAMSGNVYVATKTSAAQTLVMTYTAANGVSPNDTSVVTQTVPKLLYVVVELGQSNIDYAMNNGDPYTNAALLANIPITTVNARYVGPDGSGGVADIPVTQSNVNARMINVAVVQASQWLSFVAPGKEFVFVDAAESGTSRRQIGDDTNPGRDWADTADIVNHAQTTYKPADLVVEWWYADDESSIPNFTSHFAPLYLGQRSDGSAFTLGDTVGGTRWDHCFWDVETASLSEKGRGLFSRETKWTYVQNHHKNSSLAAANAMEAFRTDTRVAQFAAPRGTWGGHYSTGGIYGDGNTHPHVSNADGIIYFNWPIVTSVARLVGVTIHEPEYVGFEVASNGSYADVFVSLPNGGTLTTIRAKEGRAAASSPTSFHQPVMGMEVERVGSGLTKSPIHRLGQTVFDYLVNTSPAVKADYETFTPSRRGTVTIVSPGFEIHSTHGRVGRIRITPEVPFANGDKIYPMHLADGNPYAQVLDIIPTDSGSGGIPRISKPWLDFPVERVTALEDPAATYKFPGVPVRPWGPVQIISGVVTAPFVFTARSSTLSDTGYLLKSPLSTPVMAGTEGMLSVWFRCAEASWPVSSKNLYQMRDNGGTVVAGLTTASSGRLQNNISGAGITSPGTGTFAVGVWQHALLSWKAGSGGWSQYSVNGAAPIAGTPMADGAPLLSIKNAGISRFSIGSQTGVGGFWLGDIGHFYMNLTQALDLNVLANRQKFILGNNPVSLGANGEVPTGAVPAFYFDGAGGSWNNRGSAEGLTAVGTLTAGSTPVLGSA